MLYFYGRTSYITKPLPVGLPECTLLPAVYLFSGRHGLTVCFKYIWLLIDPIEQSHWTHINYGLPVGNKLACNCDSSHKKKWERCQHFLGFLCLLFLLHQLCLKRKILHTCAAWFGQNRVFIWFPTCWNNVYVNFLEHVGVQARWALLWQLCWTSVRMMEKKK